MEHFFQKIEGWFQFSALYADMVKTANDNAHFVEIGAWKGKSTSFMAVEIAKSKKNIKFDVVDTWKGSNEAYHLKDLYVKSDTLYEHFLSNMKPVEGYFNPIRMTSLEAAKLYADNSLDFVMIDASHDYENVKADVLAWLPKVKINGTIAGDDFSTDFPGVMKAVNEILPNQFTFGGGVWVSKKLS